MSQSNEGDDQNPDGSDEFNFYFPFAKPLVLSLSTPEDRAIASAWVEKLEAEPETEDEKRLRVDYLKLFLFVLQRGRLSGIFRKQPPAGPLQPFPQGFNMSDMGNLMIDQDENQGCGGGDARTVPYTIEISNDLREFVAAQEIPNFGVQMYYAWSSDEPIHKWTLFDEEKFPQYVLDKIKLLKEIKSDDKTAANTKTCGPKKICDVPLIDKYCKIKVKSPQEIEKCQSRSYQTYVGMMGRMGNGFKDTCDDDPDKFRRQDQRSNRCQKKTPRKCATGPNQGDPNEMGMGEEFDNFLTGLGGNPGNQGRNNCACPAPLPPADCEPQMNRMCDNQQQQQQQQRSNSSRCRNIPNENPSSPQQWYEPKVSSWAPPNRHYSPMAPAEPCPDQYMGEDLQPNACQRRSASPVNRNCLMNRNEPNPQQMNNCNLQREAGGRAASLSSCTCPCPREIEEPSGRPGPSMAVGRGNEDACQRQEKVQVWYEPQESKNFKFGPNNEIIPITPRYDQGQPKNQQRCPNEYMGNAEDASNLRRKDKLGKSPQRECGGEERMDMSSCPRAHQNTSCPPRQASPAYPSCSAAASSPAQCKSRRQEGEEICRRDVRMPIIPDPDRPPARNESVMAHYGSPVVPVNNEWYEPVPVYIRPRYDFGDECNNEQQNQSRARNANQCETRGDACPRMKEQCNQSLRTSPSNRKAQHSGVPEPISGNANGGRLCNMSGIMEAAQQKTESHREKCEAPIAPRSMQNDVCQRNVQQQPRQQQPRQLFCQQPQQVQSCGSPAQTKKIVPDPAIPGPSWAGRSYNMLQSGSKQSQQGCCSAPQQSRKSPPPMYDTYTVQKGNASMMGACPSGHGNFKESPNRQQGMNRQNMQVEECPEMCPQEQVEDNCGASGPESADNCPQESSSGECLNECDEEAEAADEVPSPFWLQNQDRQQERKKGFVSFNPKKAQACQKGPQMGSYGKSNRFYCSTPKQPSFTSCEAINAYSDTSNAMANTFLRPMEQSCQNFITLQDANITPFMQGENYRTFNRGPCPSANDQGFAGQEEAQSRSPCPRNKDKKRRGGPLICDDNNQFDDGCKQACGF